MNIVFSIKKGMGSESVMNYRHIFGPIRSRRLGISLGVNLFERKTCSLNCVYCECGKTDITTIERREYVPTQEVVQELDHFFSVTDQKPDFVTFSGSGEPTLHTGLGDIVAHLKIEYPSQKVALLTNATLFKDQSVRNAVLNFDLIVPSVDAISPAAFQRIYGAPHPSLNPADFKEGLLSLRKEYTGSLVVELFVIHGLNDTAEELALLKEFFYQLSPDAIQLNSLDRKAAYDWVKEANMDTLLSVREFFREFRVEIVKCL